MRDHISFISLNKNSEEITHSSVINVNGINHIKLYFEKVNDEAEDFDNFTYQYPEDTICENNGYTEEEINKRLPKLKALAEIAIDEAIERGYICQQ